MVDTHTLSVSVGVGTPQLEETLLVLTPAQHSELPTMFWCQFTRMILTEQQKQVNNSDRFPERRWRLFAVESSSMTQADWTATWHVWSFTSLQYSLYNTQHNTPIDSQTVEPVQHLAKQDNWWHSGKQRIANTATHNPTFTIQKW